MRYLAPAIPAEVPALVLCVSVFTGGLDPLNHIQTCGGIRDFISAYTMALQEQSLLCASQKQVKEARPGDTEILPMCACQHCAWMLTIWLGLLKNIGVETATIQFVF